MEIYLEKSIFINGIEVRHTVYGLKNRLELYEHMLKTAAKDQLDDKARKHIEEYLIPTYQLHLKLYEQSSSTNQ